MFKSIDISYTSLQANKLHMEVISNNIANVNTTRTSDGMPFRASKVSLRAKGESVNFKSHLLPKLLQPEVGNGVEVSSISKDMKPLKYKYDPGHPDAIRFGAKKGYVAYSNVDIVEQMVNMMSVSRSYEASVTLINSSKQMFVKAMQIGN